MSTCHDDPEVDVYVKLPKGSTAVYYISGDETIQSLCGRIAEEEKVLQSQVRLKYEGKFLNGNSSMADLGVRAETILKAEIRVPRSITLEITQLDKSDRTELTFSTLDTIAHVKSIVADIIKEEDANIKLMHEGKTLRHDDDTLLDAGLCDGSEVLVRVIQPPPTVSTGRPYVLHCCIVSLSMHMEETISNPEVRQWCERVYQNTTAESNSLLFPACPEELAADVYRYRRSKQLKKSRKCSVM